VSQIRSAHAFLAPRVARALLFSLAAALAACSGGDGPTGPPEPKPVASLIVSPGADTLIALGRTRTYSAVARDADGVVLPGASVKWRSSDTLVARVDSLTGVVTAVANGGATISALSGSVTGTGTVSVIQFVATVAVTPGTSGLATIGATQPFTAVARDSANAVVPGVRFLWSSSNQAAATVDTSGMARAVGEGTTTISATGRGVPAYATLTVTQAATQLAFSVEPADVAAGSAFATALQVEVRDAGGALVRESRVAVTLSLIAPPIFLGEPATLWGSRTVNAVGGIANFGGLWVDRKDAGYLLRATATNLASDTSAAFDVRSGPARDVRIQVGGNPVLEAGVGSSGAAQLTFYDAFGNVTDTVPQYDIGARNTWGNDIAVTHSTPVVTGGQVQYDQIAFRAVSPQVELMIAFSDGNGPTRIARSDPFAVHATHSQIAISSTHSCALATGGVLCWGSNAAQQLLIDGSFLVDSIPRLLPISGTYTQVTVRPNVTCLLRSDGGVECYGAGPDGLVPGTGPGGTVLTQITAGGDFQCGITADGRAFCWGNGPNGELGDGTAGSSASPVQVTGSGPGGTVFTAIDAGSMTACALSGDGTAYCWGYNASGEVGDSTQFNRSTPSKVARSGPGLMPFLTIDVGGAASCATTIVGSVVCWGRGPLGDGTASFSSVPIGIEFAFGGAMWTAVSVGEEHACILLQDPNGPTSLYCWGINRTDQVGPNAGAQALFRIPVDVAGHHVFGVVAGQESTCARTDNGIYCWGNNSSGRLGLGYTEPTRVRPPTRIMQ